MVHSPKRNVGERGGKSWSSLGLAWAWPVLGWGGQRQPSMPPPGGLSTWGGLSPPLLRAGTKERKGRTSGSEAAGAKQHCLLPAPLLAPSAPRQDSQCCPVPPNGLSPSGAFSRWAAQRPGAQGSGHPPCVSLRGLDPRCHITTTSANQGQPDTPVMPSGSRPSGLQPHLPPQGAGHQHFPPTAASGAASATALPLSAREDRAYGVCLSHPLRGAAVPAPGISPAPWSS